MLTPDDLGDTIDGEVTGADLGGGARQLPLSGGWSSPTAPLESPGQA